MTTIQDFHPGDSIEGFYALRKLERRQHPGGERLSLELGDATGRIDAVMWDGYDGVIEELITGRVVKLRGSVGTYRDRPQLRIDKIRAALDQEVDPSDFIPCSPVDPAQLDRDLDLAISGLTDKHLSDMMTRLFSDKEFRRQYLQAPAGKLWHHNTIGGLAEHSLNLVRLCQSACDMYPELNRDLLVCGAILHDIGKVEQYNVGSMIDYSDEGRLVGHINSGDYRVTAVIRSMEDFPGETERLLRHLILSHHGALEHGSPVVPQTSEAFVLYYADELDSKMGALRRLREKSGESGWTDYVKLIDRFIYFGRPESRPTT